MVRGQRVDARGDGRPHRGRELPSDVGTLRQRRGELLEEERVSSRHPDQSSHRVWRKHFADQVLDDLGALRAQGVTEVFFDLNQSPQVCSPDVDTGAALAYAERVLDAFAPAHAR